MPISIRRLSLLPHCYPQTPATTAINLISVWQQPVITDFMCFISSTILYTQLTGSCLNHLIRNSLLDFKNFISFNVHQEYVLQFFTFSYFRDQTISTKENNRVQYIKCYQVLSNYLRDMKKVQSSQFKKYSGFFFVCFISLPYSHSIC